MELPEGMEHEFYKGVRFVVSYGASPDGLYVVSADIIKNNPGGIGLEKIVIDDPYVLMSPKAVRKRIANFKEGLRAAIRSNPQAYK